MVQALFFFLFSLFFSVFTVKLPDTGPEPISAQGISLCYKLGFHCLSLSPNLVSDCISVSLSVLKSKGKSASVKIELQSQSSHFITWIQIVFYRWLTGLDEVKVIIRTRKEDSDMVFTFEWQSWTLPLAFSISSIKTYQGKTRKQITSGWQWVLATQWCF